jgi:hypothetical protein
MRQSLSLPVLVMVAFVMVPMGPVAAAEPAGPAEPVDLELVLAADGSGSIDDEELAL